MDEQQWPEVVPILSAGDMCRGELFDDGKCCLYGWSQQVFRRFGQQETVDQMLGGECGNAYVSMFNDDPANSLKKVAGVWNRVMRKLGYTVPCERG